MAAQKPINPGDLEYDRNKMAAFATPTRNPPAPPEAEPIAGMALGVPRGSFAAYAPPPERGEPVVKQQSVPDRQLPIGGCTHPFDNRWTATGLGDDGVDGCTLCGLAMVRVEGEGWDWRSDDDWTLAARQASMIGPS